MTHGRLIAITGADPIASVSPQIIGASAASAAMVRYGIGVDTAIDGRSPET